MPHLFVRGGSVLSAMKAQRTTTQNLAAASVYEKIVGLVVVTGTHPETVLVDDEFEANGSGSWQLDVAITHSTTSSGSGVRLLRKPVGGSYAVLQAWSISGTFHTGVSGSITVPVERGDLVRVEAMHANGFTRDITSAVLTATLV